MFFRVRDSLSSKKNKIILVCVMNLASKESLMTSAALAQWVRSFMEFRSMWFCSLPICFSLYCRSF